MRFARTLIIALLTCALLVPAAALASGDDVIQDCADDGVIDGNYSDRELREAERDLPSDIDEYTDCREAIRGELGSDRGSGSGPGDRPGRGRAATDPNLVTDSGAVAGSREDRDALDDLTGSRGGDGPSIVVGGRQVTPGEAGKLLGAAQASNDLPGSLISALVLLVLCAVAGTALLIRRRGLPALPAFVSRVDPRRIFRR